MLLPSSTKCCPGAERIEVCLPFKVHLLLLLAQLNFTSTFVKAQQSFRLYVHFILQCKQCSKLMSFLLYIKEYIINSLGNLDWNLMNSKVPILVPLGVAGIKSLCSVLSCNIGILKVFISHSSNNMCKFCIRPRCTTRYRIIANLLYITRPRRSLHQGWKIDNSKEGCRSISLIRS